MFRMTLIFLQIVQIIVIVFFSVLIDHQAEVERLKETHRLSLIEVGAEQVKARSFLKQK